MDNIQRLSLAQLLQLFQAKKARGAEEARDEILRRFRELEERVQIANDALRKANEYAFWEAHRAVLKLLETIHKR